ncbi:MAG: Spy/CpxP family protein refolding chaperone [Bacteroidales bacterium]|nr:Spy/CpxP family protein refolding chaperone [Bacteroidales bacterium]
MKKTVVTKSLLVLLVSVLITSFSLNSYAQRGPREFRDSARIDHRIPNLTADQKTKIETLRTKHLKEVTPLRNELDEKRAHLKTLESMEKVDRDAINKTIDEITTLQGKIVKMKVNHRLDVASLLTDEQKVFFNSHREMRGKGGHMRHPGMERMERDHEMMQEMHK